MGRHYGSEWATVAATVARSETLKAKFHYASWFEAGSKLVADRYEAKFHYAIWFEAGSKLVADRLEAGQQLRTRLRPASNQLRTR